MTEQPLHLVILVGSTREGRFADVVADWFAAQARRRDDLEVEVVDLADAALPAVYPARDTASVARFSARLDAADAFVIVTPEYNHSFPAALKQALDLTYREWNAKPVGFVSYGGVSGGLRAVEQLRPVLAELHAVTVRDTVSFHGARGRFDARGRPRDPDGPTRAAEVMLGQLVWWAEALRDARHARPYAA
jgi:NAD(P)H-dependent FMN reductase